MVETIFVILLIAALIGVDGYLFFGLYKEEKRVEKLERESLIYLGDNTWAKKAGILKEEAVADSTDYKKAYEDLEELVKDFVYADRAIRNANQGWLGYISSVEIFKTHVKYLKEREKREKEKAEVSQIVNEILKEKGLIPKADEK